MEAVLFIIVLVVLISNNGKVKQLTTKIEGLDNKIDDLKQLLLRNQSQKGTSTEKSVVKKAEYKPEPKAPIVPEPSKPTETVKTDEEVLKEQIHAATIKEMVEAKPISDIEIKEKTKEPIKVKFQKEKIPQKTLSDKLSEKIENFKKNNPDIEKFIGENLISKIGILILVLGISFFVKFAIDNEWINEIGRVGIGFLSGGILLGFAHKLQKNYKAFSSILVSGAITVFYFIITYAFKEYQLFNQTTAFGLLVLVTIFSVAISILYNRKELGVLSLIGGFAVPILASTGNGNYVVLFSYLLILNIGFLFVSIKKKWFIINILTFVFTHLFFVGWLLKDSHLKENSVNLFLFATAFYFIFYLMNIFRVIKEKEYAMKPIVMLLFLISTFVYFGQGLFLLKEFAPNFKGAFTLVLAIINLVSGWVLLKNKIIDKKTVYLFIGMTLTFLTLAGPIQLEGNYITLFWAAESTLLIWLSQKMKNNDFKIVAFITIILVIGSLFMDFEQVYLYGTKLNIILNKGFTTGIFVTITLIVSAYLFHKEKDNYFIKNMEIIPSKARNIFLILAGIVLYITGLLELTHQTTKYFDNYLSATIIAIYNFIFILIGIYFALKNKSIKINNIGIGISVLTMLFSINFISSTPFYSFANSKIESVSNPTFYIQFILFIGAIYIIKLLYTYINKEINNSKDFKILKYFIAAVFVILVSLEVLIISQPILVNSKIATIESNAIYSVIANSKIAVIKTSFPILWGVLSFVFLFYGIKKNKKEFRIFALVLIAITIVKLFTYDIGNVSQGGKIIAFIILGIVLLVISFMYQRIKKLFNDEVEEKKAPNNEEE